MSTKQATPAAAPAHKLAPTVVSKAKIKAVALADGRKRPIVAINEEGKLVVCCRRTAKKNGWNIQEVLYDRAKTVKTEVSVGATPEPKRRAAPASKKSAVQAAVGTEIDTLLGM